MLAETRTLMVGKMGTSRVSIMLQRFRESRCRFGNVAKVEAVMGNRSFVLLLEIWAGTVR